jgi:hypothetical protein
MERHPHQHPRTELCLDCRTALTEGERCDGGPRHRVTQLQQEQGRERLLKEVWGAPDLRRRARLLAQGGGIGAVAAGSLKFCAGMSCECGTCVDDTLFDSTTILLIAGAVVLGMVLIYAVSLLVEHVRRRRHAPRPNGALARPRPPRGPRLCGTLELADGAALILSPGGRPVAAHGLELTASRFTRSEVMVRDGGAAELVVRLEDGRRLEIPAGRVRVDLSARTRQLRRADLERYIEALDPLRLTRTDESDPLPFDRAREAHLMPGDRVEVLGACEPFVDPGAPDPAGYRQEAGNVLRPVGVPWLRALS